MSQSFLEFPRPCGSIADYLADREGLDGRARLVFLRLLRDAFGFRLSPVRRVSVLLVGVAVLLAGFGLVIEVFDGQGLRATMPWFAMALGGIALSLVVGWRRNHVAAINHEFEWRAYCLLIRPLILHHRPGLLDRNLRADPGAQEGFDREISGALRDMTRTHDHDVWVSAGVGWALGSMAAIVWRLAFGDGAWTWLFSVGSALVGPPVWSLFRWWAFDRLRRTASDSR